MQSGFNAEKGVKIVWFIIVLLQVLTIIFWANKKGNYYWDEYYTYMGANDVIQNHGSDSYLMYNPYIEFDVWTNRENLISEFTINGISESILRENPIYILSHIIKSDIKLYDVFINIIGAFCFPNVVSKWTGIIINIFFFICTQLALYRLSICLFKSRMGALIAVFAYGFSTMAQSMAIFIRQYTFSNFIVVIATICFFVAHNNNNFSKKILYLVLSGVLFFLAFTMNPLSIVFGGGLIFASMLFFISNRVCEKKQIIPINIIVFVAVLVIVIMVFSFSPIKDMIFPQDINADSAPSALLRNLISITPNVFMGRLINLAKLICKFQFGSFLVFAIYSIYIIIRMLRERYDKKKWDSKCSVLVITIVLYCIFAVLYDLVVWERYLSVIFPFLSVVISYLVTRYDVGTKSGIEILLVPFLVMGFIICSNRADNISYLYSQDYELTTSIKQMDVRNIYVDSWAIWTQDEAVVLPQQAKQIYLKSKDTEANYIEFPNEFLAWFYNYAGDCNTTNLTKISAAGYEVTELGQTYISKIYLCKK